jgi:hypothetical protein
MANTIEASLGTKPAGRNDAGLTIPASEKNPQKALVSYFARYLSPQHRDTYTGGCPASALPVDAARNGKTVQAAFANGIDKYLDLFVARIGGDPQAARRQSFGFAQWRSGRDDAVPCR